MKTWLALTLGFFALLGATQTYANTIFPLQVPADVPAGNQPAARTCSAKSFNADDTSVGTCNSSYALPTSGHAGAVSYKHTVFVASWDTQGNVISDQFCGTVLTRPVGAPVWTYAAGFDASTCYLPISGYPDILVFDAAYGYQVWFGYVTTSPDGAYELLTMGRRGFINQF